MATFGIFVEARMDMISIWRRVVILIIKGDFLALPQPTAPTFPQLRCHIIETITST